MWLMQRDLRVARIGDEVFQVPSLVGQVGLSVEQRERTCYDLVDRDGLTFSTKIPDGQKVVRKRNSDWTREKMDTAQKEDHQIDRALIGWCSSPSKSQRQDGEKKRMKRGWI